MTGGEDWAIRQVAARTANQVHRSRIALVAAIVPAMAIVGSALWLALYLRTASTMLAPVHDQAGTG